MLTCASKGIDLAASCMLTPLVTVHFTFFQTTAVPFYLDAS
jgi:hypothetical protein